MSIASKYKGLSKYARTNIKTYGLVIALFAILFPLQNAGMISNSISGQLIPICAYIVMAISLNLTVGVLGELSLGHAGFMSVGAFSGIIAAMSLQSAVPNDLVRMIVALVVGAFFAAIVGFIVGLIAWKGKGRTET
mgnify:CR=1 FL=1